MYGPEGVAVLIPHEDKFKLRSDAPYWPEGVAVLIHHEDRFKVRSYSLSLRSYSMYWPEGGGSFDAS